MTTDGNDKRRQLSPGYHQDADADGGSRLGLAEGHLESVRGNRGVLVWTDPLRDADFRHLRDVQDGHAQLQQPRCTYASTGLLAPPGCHRGPLTIVALLGPFLYAVILRSSGANLYQVLSRHELGRRRNHMFPKIGSLRNLRSIRGRTYYESDIRLITYGQCRTMQGIGI